MIKIEDAMQKNVIAFKPNDQISDVAEILRKNKISGAPILDEDMKVVGIVSEGDIMRLLEVHSPEINLILPSPLDLIELPLRMKHEYDEIAEGLKKAATVNVEEIMTKQVVTIKKDNNISEAAEIMDSKDIKRLPVVDDNGKIIGIVTRGDIIGAMVKLNE
ncbi:MAG: CBS domain-containing protein [Methanobacteriaceae archaeon]|nr:CBS domain-containing protein [Methanobacteriaceae archaeon]